MLDRAMMRRLLTQCGMESVVMDNATMRLAETIFAAGMEAERAACAGLANQQVMTSWNGETDSHNRCAELIRNLVLMRSNALAQADAACGVSPGAMG